MSGTNFEFEDEDTDADAVDTEETGIMDISAAPSEMFAPAPVAEEETPAPVAKKTTKGKKAAPESVNVTITDAPIEEPGPVLTPQTIAEMEAGRRALQARHQ